MRNRYGPDAAVSDFGTLHYLFEERVEEGEGDYETKVAFVFQFTGDLKCYLPFHLEILAKEQPDFSEVKITYPPWTATRGSTYHLTNLVFVYTVHGGIRSPEGFLRMVKRKLLAVLKDAQENAAIEELADAADEERITQFALGNKFAL